MFRIFQDNKGEIPELVNRSVEQIICIDGVAHNTIFTDIFLIWLKLEDSSWYRIFLDANCCFCEVYNSDNFIEVYTEDIESCEDCPIYRIDRLFLLQGLTIVAASVSLIISYGVKLKIVFHNDDCLILQAEVIDSQSNLSIIKSKI